MFIMRNISKFLASVFFVTLFTFAFLQNTTEAVSLKIENVHNNPLSVAVIYYDDSNGKWRVRGWYNVDPNSVRTIDFQTGNYGYIYLHSFMGNTKWGDGEATKTVINQAFSYFDGERCPDGPNRRDVGFTGYKANSQNQVFYKPVLKS